MRVSMLILMAIILPPAACLAAFKTSWDQDFKYQPLSSRPRLEAKYADATRSALEVTGQNYSITINLAKPGGHKALCYLYNELMRSKPAPNAISLEMVDSSGVTFTSTNSKKKSRINIYRRGPYYIEVHWLDVELADSNASPAPIRGEVVFYCYPEKVHVGAILHVTGNMSVKTAQITLEQDSKICIKLDNKPGEDIPAAIRLSTGAIIYPVPKGVDAVATQTTGNKTRVSSFIYSDSAHSNKPAAWAAGEKPATYFELIASSAKVSDSAFDSELHPMPISSITCTAGKFVGYDPKRGCYTIQTDSIGGFNEHFKNPNAYETAAFTISNDDRSRKIYILHETGKNPGTVECGAVLDEGNNILPITVQISKNFRGEFEEKFYNPDDTPFSETFFPLYLAPNEKRTLTSLHLYENWGNHRLKQFSSLGAWMDYYHMSTGVTETTCYVPFNFAGLPGVSIADFRPLSQRYWGSQPQHDNVAGHSFLRYQDADGKWHYAEYTGTEFRSTGPNWADMSIGYLSDDGKAKVKIDVFEVPQTDELRNFIHMRVDFLEDINIKDGDLARNVRLLNAATWVQGMRYKNVAYGGPEGEPTIVPIKLNDDFTIAGAPLPAQNGYVTICPDQRGANAFIVRNCSGKIGGKPAGLGISVIGWEKEGEFRNPGDTILMLVPATDAKEIKAGDFIETDLFLMPYGGGTQTPDPAKKAAYDFGANAPKLTSIKSGTKISDFPTRIRLSDKQKAEFTVTGGCDYIPIIIEGAKDYRTLRLYCTDDGKKTLIEHSQPERKDGYQVFIRPDNPWGASYSFGYVFLYKTDGKEHKFVVEDSNAGSQ